MVPPNADKAAHAAPPQNSRLVVFTVIMRILYQIRGNRATRQSIAKRRQDSTT